MALYHDKHTDESDRGILRTILGDGMWTDNIRAKLLEDEGVTFFFA